METEHPRDDQVRACLRCLWWRPRNSVTGHCKRMPPARPDGEAEGYWPMTGRGDWCGEYRDAARAAPGAADVSELKPVDCLPTITEEDRQFLHYNPNTQDVVDWVVGYALASIEEWNRRAQPEPAASADADYPCRSDGRCQYAIDHGAEGMGHCPRGKCAMADAAPSVAPEPVAWQERQEVERGVFGDWYTTNSGWSTLRPPEILSGGIRYQFRPLYAHPPRAPLTEEQKRDLVKECDLDWQRGFMPLFDGDPTNRYAVLIEAVEAAHGIGGK